MNVNTTNDTTNRHAQEWRQDVVNCCNALMTQYMSLLNSATVAGLSGSGDSSGLSWEKRDEVERVIRVMLDEKSADEEATEAASKAAAGKDGGDRGGGEITSG
ncbi:hypothetical protein TrRE_jg12972, partial [Triparma retinervis]